MSQSLQAESPMQAVQKVEQKTEGKGSSKTVEINVGGLKVKVKTDATPAALKQVQDLIEMKFDMLGEKLTHGVSTHQATILVALNLAEELLKERERMRFLKRHTVESSERLMNRVESHLSKLQ